MKKKRPLFLRISAALAALFLIGILFFFYNAFNGNPISAAIVTARVNSYVKETYPGNDFSIKWASYDFKTNDYRCRIQSASSPDTSFFISGGISGKLYDSYETAVLEKGTTYARLDNALNEEACALLKQQFPYRCQIFYCYFSEKETGTRDKLILDMPFELHNLPYPAALTVYVEAGQKTPTWEELAQKLLLLKKAADENQIHIAYYSICLEAAYEEDKNGNLTVSQYDASLSVYDFPAQNITAEGLPERLREFSRQAERDEKK